MTSSVFMALSIFSGAPFNIYKLPEAVRWIMATNPFYALMAAVFYVTLQACDLDAVVDGSNATTLWSGDEAKLCRALAFSAWGYADFNDRGLGACLIVVWTVALATLTGCSLRHTVHRQRSVTLQPQSSPLLRQSNASSLYAALSSRQGTDDGDDVSGLRHSGSSDSLGDVVVQHGRSDSFWPDDAGQRKDYPFFLNADNVVDEQLRRSLDFGDDCAV